MAVGEVVRRDGLDVAARENCGGAEGFYYCQSCGEDVDPVHTTVADDNNFPKGGALGWHCENDGKPHVIAWVCRRHGPEVPP